MHVYCVTMLNAHAGRLILHVSYFLAFQHQATLSQVPPDAGQHIYPLHSSSQLHPDKISSLDFWTEHPNAAHGAFKQLLHTKQHTFWQCFKKGVLLCSHTRFRLVNICSMVGDKQHANALRELAAAYYIAQLVQSPKSTRSNSAYRVGAVHVSAHVLVNQPVEKCHDVLKFLSRMCVPLSKLFVGCREDIHDKLGPSLTRYLPPDKPTETPMQTALRSRM